ncbi:hypothetical protein KBD45_03210 [Candidatus Dojkabacteria bacterium]|nr:hypothetical protein [Candidatus Dojkabacteria bacterium]
MKILNILITVLVISILISGGFLGYLVYVQNNQSEVDTSGDTTTPTLKPSIIPTASEIIAQDGCSELFVQGSGNTNTISDIQFNFSSNLVGQPKIGDKVTVKTEVLSSNPAKIWKGIELRMILPCENLKFVRSIPPANGEYYAIDVKSKFDNIAEVHIVTTKETFEVQDEIVQLEFEVIKAGNIPSLEVADSSTILDNLNQKFSIATNKIPL